MIDYLDQALFKGNLSQYITSKGEDRSVASLLMGGWRGLELYLWGELSKLQKLQASETYGGFS